MSFYHQIDHFSQCRSTHSAHSLKQRSLKSWTLFLELRWSKCLLNFRNVMSRWSRLIKLFVYAFDLELVSVIHNGKMCVFVAVGKQQCVKSLACVHQCWLVAKWPNRAHSDFFFDGPIHSEHSDWLRAIISNKANNCSYL